MLVNVCKWGNSQGIRLSKELLKQIGVYDIENTQLELDVHNKQIILKKHKRNIDELFKGYEGVPYPFEIVDKGEAVGRELI